MVAMERGDEADKTGLLHRRATIAFRNISLQRTAKLSSIRLKPSKLHEANDDTNDVDRTRISPLSSIMPHHAPCPISLVPDD